MRALRIACLLLMTAATVAAHPTARSALGEPSTRPPPAGAHAETSIVSPPAQISDVTLLGMAPARAAGSERPTLGLRDGSPGLRSRHWISRSRPSSRSPTNRYNLAVPCPPPADVPPPAGHCPGTPAFADRLRVTARPKVPTLPDGRQ